MPTGDRRAPAPGRVVGQPRPAALITTGQRSQDELARLLPVGGADLTHELAAQAREHGDNHSWVRVEQGHLARWTALEAT